MDSLRLDEWSDVAVDYLRGKIYFFQPPDSGRELYVAYRRLPFRLQLEYRHWTASDSTVMEEKTPTVVTRMAPRKEAAREDYGSALQKSGSIFRGISLGTNQGMRLQSGLRLQVSGNIASNVEVVASLTDQNTPIQPEGNTQTLQEIDKVFVDIRTSGFRATLGDYVFDAGGTRFSTYSKKLQGVMGTAESSFGSLTVSAAASKGEFTSNQFMGREGNQGPYQLTGSRGQREIIVLAGTERVWIDGMEMTRGEENDYTIEYGNGQIAFTRNRLITDDSRIAVDFEYSDQKFQKEIYGLTGEARLWNDRVTLRTSLIREADDKDHPLDIPLTDAYQNILEQAGDDPDSAVTSGARLLGANDGSYERMETAGVAFYRYVGQNKGDYAVRFSYVGSGKGDYSLQGYGIFKYEGPGLGSYLPIIYLPVAKSHQVADIASSVELGKGIVLEGEFGLSDRDMNQYSPMDDGDNVDFAYGGQLRMDKRKIGLFGSGLGELSLRGRMEHVGDAFRSVGRMTEVEHGRKWGVEEGVYWGESIRELGGAYQPLPFLNIEGEVGSLRRTDSLRSGRWRFAAALNRPKTPTFDYQAERIGTDKVEGSVGYWLRQRGNIGWKWKWLNPSFHYEGEHRKEEEMDSVRTGFRFDEWTGRLAAERGILRVEYGKTIRDDRRYAGSMLVKNSLATTDRIKLDFQLMAGLTSSLMYTHRNRDYADPETVDQRADLADVKVQLSPGRGFLNGTLNYRFSSTQVSEMVRDTIQVGEGLGTYRYDQDLKEFVPDPDGDILFRMIQTGVFLPVNDLKMGGEFRLDGSRVWREKKGFLRFLGRLQARSILRVDRRDKERDFGKVNLSAFRPRWGADSTVVMGLVSFHQDVEYSHPASGFSLRYRYRTDDSESHQLVSEGLVRRRTEQNIRAKGNPFDRFGILFEYQMGKEEKEYTTRAWSNRDIHSKDLTMEASYRPRQKVELGLRVKYRIAHDFYPDPVTAARSVFLLPRFGYSFRSRGNLRAELEWGEVRASPLDRTLPYEMLGGDQPGRTLRWTLLLTYRVTGHVMVTLNYRGRKEPWRKELYQTGQVEVRAFF